MLRAERQLVVLLPILQTIWERTYLPHLLAPIQVKKGKYLYLPHLLASTQVKKGKYLCQIK